MTPKTPKPIIYFIRRLTGRQGGGLAVAHFRSSVKFISSLNDMDWDESLPINDTIWMSYNESETKYNDSLLFPSNVLGHELGHVLLNEGHSDSHFNIMAGGIESNGNNFTKKQCDMMKTHPFVKPIR